MKLSDIVIPERHRKDLGDIEALAKSIEEIGLLHPIVVTPENKLVVGQRRLEAYKLLGLPDIPHRVVDNLTDALALLKAEGDENTCRKDFDPTEAVDYGKDLEQQLKPLMEEKQRQDGREGGKQGGRGKKKPDKTLGANCAKGNGREPRTNEVIGAAVGMGARTYEKAKQIVEAAEQQPDLFGDLPERMDEKSVDNAHKELKRRERKQEAQAIKDLPDKIYNVIYADPPWKYDNTIAQWGPAELHYEPMPTKDICALPKKIGLQVAENAVLFLWVTNPFLEDAFKVVKKWGFNYKTNIVWVKTELKKPGSGFYVRGRHELLFICTRGSFTPLDSSISPPIGSVLESPVLKHSQKPEKAYEIIERLYPGCAYIELFARGKRNGWDVWGDEAG